MRNALLTGLAVICVCALALLLPWKYGLFLLAAGFFGFVIYLFLHPTFSYRGLPGAILAAWVAVGGLPTLKFVVQFGDNSLARFVVESAGIWVHLCFGVALLAWMVLLGRGKRSWPRFWVGIQAPTQTAHSSSQPIQIFNPSGTINITHPAEDGAVRDVEPPGREPAEAGPRAGENHRIVASTIRRPRFFEGRREEMAQLKWALSSKVNVACVLGMAGQGKSSLVGHWYFGIVRDWALRKIFWCRPYDLSYSFARFLADVLAWLYGPEYDARKYPTTEAQVQLLCDALRREEVLLVFDGLERWLAGWVNNPDREAAESSAADRRAADPGLDTLLADAVTWQSGSRVLLTSRALPEVLRNLPHTPIGTGAAGTLGGLDPGAAVQLLRRLGVKGSDDDLQAAAAAYGRHPFALTVLGGRVKEQYGGDLGQWLKDNPGGLDADPELERLLSGAIKCQAESVGVLQVVAVSVEAAPVAMVAAVLKEGEPEIRARLARLASWNLVDFDAGVADEHPLLRRHVQRSLGMPDRKALSRGIAEWLLEQPIPAEPKSLEELHSRLWATNQLLSCEDPEGASRVISRQVDQGRLLSLHGWLGAFGYHSLRVDLYSRLAPMYTHLVESEGRRELRNDLASVYNNRGTAYANQGELEKAVDDYSRALELYVVLVESEGRRELRNDLAMVYNNRGNAYRAQGELEKAVDDYSRALELYVVLVESEGRRELRNGLAMVYNNRGTAYSDQGELGKSLDDFSRGLELYVALVESEGQRELRNDLARVYSNRGNAYGAQGELEKAVDDFSRALELYVMLVESEGRRELRNGLAMVYNNQGNAYYAQGELDKAADDFSRGLELYVVLVESEGRRELTGDYATVLLNRGVARADRKDWDGGREDIDASGELVGQAVCAGRLHLVPHLVRIVCARLGLEGSIPLTGAVATWLGQIAAALRSPGAPSTSNPVWKREVTRLHEVVREHEAGLRTAGADVEDVLAAIEGWLAAGPGPA